MYRKAQQSKKSKKNKVIGEGQQVKKVIETHQNYIEQVNLYVTKAKATMELLIANSTIEDAFLPIYITEINSYITHAERQIDQISRRVINGEIIPHSEKIFSIFEPYTEWINKGKSGVFVELGLKVCIMSDQYGFILHHQVMQKQTDEQIAISMVEETQNRFPAFILASFDRGFYSARNKQSLSEKLDCLGLPKKGYKSKEDKVFENSEEFKRARNKHARVESDINALEVHGLDRCLDQGLLGFKRYAAVSVTARNLQIVGVIIRNAELKKINKQNKNIFNIGTG